MMKSDLRSDLLDDASGTKDEIMILSNLGDLMNDLAIWFFKCISYDSTRSVFFFVVEWVILTIQQTYFISSEFVPFNWRTDASNVFFDIAKRFTLFPFSAETQLIVSLALIAQYIVGVVFTLLTHHNLNWMLPIKIARYVALATPIFYLPIMIPLLKVVFGCIAYSSDELTYNPFNPSLICWSSDHLPYVVFSIQLGVIFYAFNWALLSTFYPIDIPGDIQRWGNIINSRVNNNAEIFMLHAKTVFLILAISGHQSNWTVALSAIIAASGSWYLYLSINGIVYWEYLPECLYACTGLIYTWSGISAFILRLMSEQNSSAIFYYCFMPLLAITAPLLVNYRYEQVSQLKDELLTCPEDAHHLVRHLARAYFCSIHGSQTEYVELTEEVSTQRIEVIEAVDSLMKLALLRFPNNAEFRLNASLFYSQICYNRIFAYRQIQTAKRMNLTFADRFRLSFVQEILQEASALVQSAEVTHYIEFKLRQTEVQKVCVQAMRKLVMFWSLLMESSPDVEKVAEVGFEARNLQTATISHYERMLELNPNSIPVLRNLASIRLDITGEVNSAFELFEIADQIEQAKKLVLLDYSYRDFQTIINNVNLDIFDEDNGIVGISLNEGSMGIVESVNASQMKMLGLTHSGDLVGKNISTIVPEPFSSMHDAYIESYLRTKQSHVVNHVRLVLSVHTNGFLVPLIMYVRWADEQLAKMVAIMQPIVNQLEVAAIIDGNFNNDHRVLHCTSNQISLFGFNRKDYMGKNILLSQIVPDLAGDVDVSENARIRLLTKTGLTYIMHHHITQQPMEVTAYLTNMEVKGDIVSYLRCNVVQLHTVDDHASIMPMDDEDDLAQMLDSIPLGFDAAKDYAAENAMVSNRQAVDKNSALQSIQEDRNSSRLSAKSGAVLRNNSSRSKAGYATDEFLTDSMLHSSATVDVVEHGSHQPAPLIRVSSIHSLQLGYDSEGKNITMFGNNNDNHSSSDNGDDIKSERAYGATESVVRKNTSTSNHHLSAFENNEEMLIASITHGSSSSKALFNEDHEARGNDSANTSQNDKTPLIEDVGSTQTFSPKKNHARSHTMSEATSASSGTKRNRIAKGHLRLGKAIEIDNQHTSRKLSWLTKVNFLTLLLCIALTIVVHVFTATHYDHIGVLSSNVYESCKRPSLMMNTLFYYRVYRSMVANTNPVLLDMFYTKEVHGPKTASNVINYAMSITLDTLNTLYDTNLIVDNKATSNKELRKIRDTDHFSMKMLNGNDYSNAPMSLKTISRYFTALTRVGVYDTRVTSRQKDPPYFFLYYNVLKPYGFLDIFLLNSNLIIEEIVQEGFNVLIVVVCMYAAQIGLAIFVLLVLMRPIVMSVEQAKTDVLDVFLEVPYKLRKTLRKKAYGIYKMHNLADEATQFDQQNEENDDNKSKAAGSEYTAVSQSSYNNDSAQYSSMFEKYKLQSQLNATSSHDKRANSAHIAIGGSVNRGSSRPSAKQAGDFSGVEQTSGKALLQPAHEEKPLTISLHEMRQEDDLTEAEQKAESQQKAKQKSVYSRRSVMLLFIRFFTFVSFIIVFFVVITVLSSNFEDEIIGESRRVSAASRRAPYMQLTTLYALLHVQFKYDVLSVGPEAYRDPHLSNGQSFIKAGFNAIGVYRLAHFTTIYGDPLLSISRKSMPDLDHMLMYDNACDQSQQHRFDTNVVNGCKTFHDGVLGGGFYTAAIVFGDYANELQRPGMSGVLEVTKPPSTDPVSIRAIELFSQASAISNDFGVPMMNESTKIYYERLASYIKGFKVDISTIVIVNYCVLLFAFFALLYPITISLVEASSKTKAMLLLLPPEVIRLVPLAQAYIDKHLSQQ